MKTKFLMILLAAGLLASCSEEDNPVGKFNSSGEFIVDIKQPVSAEDFSRCAVGYGWREAETYEIMSDGTVAKKDYWEGMCGGGPLSYEFGEGRATLFVYMDAYPSRSACISTARRALPFLPSVQRRSGSSNGLVSGAVKIRKYTFISCSNV